MACSAMAREAIFALRQEIARIEGAPPERLHAPAGKDGDGETVLRHYGRPESVTAVAGTGTSRFDAALGGGIPQAALTEIIGRESRDGGLVCGFALAFAAIVSRDHGNEAQRARPIFWVSMADILGEAGLPYVPGMERFFGVMPDRFLMARAGRLEDALWVAEEGARTGGFSAVFLELRGNPARLSLTATRRLHHRAREAGQPVFLVRHSAEPEPTAAPTRLLVSPAPSRLREIISGPLSRSIGPPVFAVSLDKSRVGRNENFILEWNAHDFAFREKGPVGDRQSVQENVRKPGPQDTGGLVPASSSRSDSAATARDGLAPAERKRKAG